MSTPAIEPLPRPVVDTHCHLNLGRGEQLPPDPVDALAAAAAVNVTRLVQVGVDVATSRRGVALARQHPQVVAAVALHPNEAPRLAQRGELASALAEIEALLADPRVRAVGETGLDYYRTEPDGRPAQQESFRAHIAMAARHDKTLVIHDRDAHDDIVTLLEQAPQLPQRVVFHCFSGDVALARRCADHGWYASFAGTLTFKNAAALREAAAVLPVELLLTETDAPYLAPAPYRGQTNTPALMALTVQELARVRGQELAGLCEQLAANAERAFGGPW